MYTRNKVWIWVYIGFIVLAVGPLVISLLTGGIANVLGCQISEAGTNCPLPSLFYDLGELFWFSFFTFPIGVIGVVVTGIAHAVRAIRKSKSTAV